GKSRASIFCPRGIGPGLRLSSTLIEIGHQEDAVGSCKRGLEGRSRLQHRGHRFIATRTRRAPVRGAAERSDGDSRRPSHPLAKSRGGVSVSTIAKHVQLVLSDRRALSEGRDFGVLSPLTWRLADLGAKHAFLKAGLGWGHMPLHMVKADVDSGGPVNSSLEAIPRA